jgi:K+-sensing histidine kinase KdpD
MQKVFYNMLVPVDPGKSTAPIVEKAVHLANRLECNLHLVYTIPPASALENFFLRDHTEKRIKDKCSFLSALQKRFSREMKPGCFLIISIQRGDAHEQTVRYAAAHSIDLVYYDETTGLFHTPFLDINRLTAALDCPLLIGKQEPNLDSIDKIVLPVDDQLSADHVRVAIFMAQQLGAAIHLVSDGRDGHDAKSMRYLTKAYELLKDNTGLELVCSTLSGNETGQSTLHYAQSVRAGLIVTNRQGPSGFGDMPGFLQGSFFRRDQIPVLLV